MKTGSLFFFPPVKNVADHSTFQSIPFFLFLFSDTNFHNWNTTFWQNTLFWQNTYAVLDLLISSYASKKAHQALSPMENSSIDDLN